MQITITARHFEITDAIKTYAETSVRRLKKYFENIIYVDIVLSIEKIRNIAEINLHYKKADLISKAEEKDMYKAIDVAVEKMEKQIKRHLSKIRTHPNKEESRNQLLNIISEEMNNIQKNGIHLKTKKIIANRYLVDEALEKLEKGNNRYLIFKNIETGKINILIKDKEDSFQLIEAIVK
ncbi:MAG: ribosome-associated translation inhibitor RaiA [Candidatus Cloacimonadota bacterium]|nr:MAG: ribosome-associated translation inhibitor RaiA [Candidatus Cloacimonadota bacterium]